MFKLHRRSAFLHAAPLHFIGLIKEFKKLKEASKETTVANFMKNLIAQIVFTEFVYK